MSDIEYGEYISYSESFPLVPIDVGPLLRELGKRMLWREKRYPWTKWAVPRPGMVILAHKRRRRKRSEWRQTVWNFQYDRKKRALSRKGWGRLRYL